MLPTDLTTPHPATPLTPRAPWRIWLARGIAVAADLAQLALIPALPISTAEGVFSPIADGIDILAAGLLTLLVGWHIAFIPSFLIKLLPFADLAPTWTIAIGIVTWPKKSEPLKK
jgi:hypothetical protein